MVASFNACSGGSLEPVAPAEARASRRPRRPRSSDGDAEREYCRGRHSRDQCPISPEPGLDIKVVPMKFSGDPPKAVIELRADGTVWVTKGAKSTKIGSFVKNTFASDNGKLTISVWKDNSITATDQQYKLRFDDKDALVAEGGTKISIDEKGKVDLVEGTLPEQARPPPTSPDSSLTGDAPPLIIALFGMLASPSMVMPTE